ncbi:peptide ABC transporter permease [Microtetraspora sp. NBRC 13810]|uniref:ABC transporter permease n=1 Tax=Microtetraspora sp. NBRC 13810 TaxID=3030990 RepID=UPI0024A4C0B9|nr:ABC transporter permease [Microtetraspora sp. NBRC 13810]GLW11709.1 peptide ABC transporter permease [Microtetraspora sp. NBRC 13810]
MNRPRRILAALPYLVLGGYGLVAVLGPVLIGYNPRATDVVSRLLPPGSATGAGEVAWLGTDALGRDVLAQIVYGARTSVLIGVATVLASAVIGLTLGVIAGYAGGWVDAVLTRCFDVLLAFPGILLAIVIAGVFERSPVVVVAALSVTAWIPFARVARGSALATRERGWVDAARVMGVGHVATLRRHILPFTAGPVVALATLEFGLVVLAEAGLSFLGIGLPPSTVSWGQIIAGGKDYLQIAWWISTLPGIALTLLVISVGLFSDQLTRRTKQSH